MARNHGRILASIWSDPDFTALDPSPQRMFLFLLSQPDLNHAGVIALRERRWANASPALTADHIREDLKALATSRFVVVDEDTEEVLVRSLIRRDEIWKQPNVLLSAVHQIESVSSWTIKAAMAAELGRIKSENDLSERVRGYIDQGIKLLAPNPSPNPPGNPSPDPSANGNGNPNGNQLSATRETYGVGEGVSSSLTSPSEVVTFVSATESHDATPDPELDLEPEPPPDAPPRLDVERICQHLADRIEANGSRRPTIGRRWRTAARLMLDRDNLAEDQIHRAIDWCQDDEFWRSNVLSLPKLRDKYDQLRLQAARSRALPATRAAPLVDRKQQATDELFDRAAARARARTEAQG